MKQGEDKGMKCGQFLGKECYDVFRKEGEDGDTKQDKVIFIKYGEDFCVKQAQDVFNKIRGGCGLKQGEDEGMKQGKMKVQHIMRMYIKAGWR